MYVTKAVEVFFFAEGDDFRQLVAGLLANMRAFARAWNILSMETSVVLDRGMAIERTKDAVRYRVYFNVRREEAYRTKEIALDFVGSFLREMFPDARHAYFSFRILN